LHSRIWQGNRKYMQNVLLTWHQFSWLHFSRCLLWRTDLRLNNQIVKARSVWDANINQRNCSYFHLYCVRCTIYYSTPTSSLKRQGGIHSIDKPAIASTI
jgi:hypothetical protein